MGFKIWIPDYTLGNDSIFDAEQLRNFMSNLNRFWGGTASQQTNLG